MTKTKSKSKKPKGLDVDISETRKAKMELDNEFRVRAQQLADEYKAKFKALTPASGRRTKSGHYVGMAVGLARRR